MSGVDGETGTGKGKGMSRLQQCIDALEAKKRDYLMMASKSAMDDAIDAITRILSAEPTSEECVRKEFEVWAKKHGLSIIYYPISTFKEYNDQRTRAAWNAWQAALLTAFPQQDKI